MTLSVVRALGLVTVQDLGRPGRMHEALPPGGALVPGALVAANLSLGNAAGAAAVEILGSLTVRAQSPLAISICAAAAPLSPIVRRLAAGDSLTVGSEPSRAAYLALSGGIAAPLLLGGRGAHLSAGLGSLLRAGDTLSPDAAAGANPPAPSLACLPSTVVPPAPASPASPPAIRVVVGPDLSAFAPAALSILTSAPYRILPSSDRVGTRLSGPALPRLAAYPERSRPMVRGALEVPRDGAPIVLGPEHPTTGGYPILAVIAHADLDAFFSIRLGGLVRFAVP